MNFSFPFAPKSPKREWLIVSLCPNNLSPTSVVGSTRVPPAYRERQSRPSLLHAAQPVQARAFLSALYATDRAQALGSHAGPCFAPTPVRISSPRASSIAARSSAQSSTDSSPTRVHVHVHVHVHVQSMCAVGYCGGMHSGVRMQGMHWVLYWASAQTTRCTTRRVVHAYDGNEC